MSIFVKKHYGKRGALFSFFIHVAIVIRASMSAFSRLLKFKPKTSKDVTKDDAAYSIVIAGNQQNLENGKQIAEESGRKNILYYHIENNTTGLPAKIELGQAKEIIFCEGTLSFKKIIEMMQEIDGKINIQIYSSGSSAIIGSK
jgi:L-ribulose-5-phosphate 3-epimerase UlaE